MVESYTSRILARQITYQAENRFTGPIPHALPASGNYPTLDGITLVRTRGMYSWNAIRTTCTVLLLLPLVHLAYLMSMDAVATMNSSPEAWERELEAYSAEDSRTLLPVKPILVVGGRGVKLWRNLEELLAPRPVLFRGLGDAVVEDITANYTRLIGYYQPDTVVLLPGNSEFHLRDHKSAEELVAAIRELVELDASYRTTRRFYVFTPVKTIWRPQDHATIDEAAQRLNAWARTQPQIVILDANLLLSGPDGRPAAYFFRSDGINLNEHGFLRLSMLLYTQVEADAMPSTGIASQP